MKISNVAIEFLNIYSLRISDKYILYFDHIHNSSQTFSPLLPPTYMFAFLKIH